MTIVTRRCKSISCTLGETDGRSNVCFMSESCYVVQRRPHDACSLRKRPGSNLSAKLGRADGRMFGRQTNRRWRRMVGLKARRPRRQRFRWALNRGASRIGFKG